MKKSEMVRALVIAVAVFGTNLQAKAATIYATVTGSTSSTVTQVATVSRTGDASTNSNIGWSYDLVVNQLNSSATGLTNSILESVQITIATKFGTTLTILNNTGNALSYASAATTFVVNLTDSNSNDFGDAGSNSTSLIASNLANGGSKSATYSNITGSVDNSYTNQDILNIFSGNNTVALLLNGTLYLTSTSGTTTSQNVGDNATVTVVYTYAAPEPETWLMIFGGVGLLLAGMRRKHREL